MFTNTTEGEIAHELVRLKSGEEFYAPVACKVEGMTSKRSGELIPVKVARGQYLYAMPGGTRLTKMEILQINAGLR